MNRKKDKLPYSHNAPEGYFAAFNGRLSERLQLNQHQPQRQVFLLRPKVWQAAAAIVVLGMIAEIWWNLPGNGNSRFPESPDITDITPRLEMPLPDEYLVAVLQSEQFPQLPVRSEEPSSHSQGSVLLDADDLFEAGLLSPEEFDVYEPW